MRYASECLESVVMNIKDFWEITELQGQRARWIIVRNITNTKKAGREEEPWERRRELGAAC